MTSSESVQSRAGIDVGYWNEHDIVGFMATVRHSFHLTSETTTHMTGEGPKKETSVRATCICGHIVTGMKTFEEIFALVKAHCEPL